MPIRIFRPRDKFLTKHVLRTSNRGQILGYISINSHRDGLVERYANTNLGVEVLGQMVINRWNAFKNHTNEIWIPKNWRSERQNIGEYLLSSTLFMSYGDRFNKKRDKFA